MLTGVLAAACCSRKHSGVLWNRAWQLWGLLRSVCCYVWLLLVVCHLALLRVQGPRTLALYTAVLRCLTSFMPHACFLLVCYHLGVWQVG
jgi:hypothetical protein